jgi:vancomycin resistance protein YoaR
MRLISLGRAQIAGLACLPLVALAVAFASSRARQHVLDGVWLGGIDLSGLSSAQATQRLEERARSLAASKLQLRIGEERLELPMGEVGVVFAPRASAARALQAGRGPSLLSDAWRYLQTFWWVEQLPAVVRTDADKLSRALDLAEAKLIDDPPRPAGLEVVSGEPRPIAARSGRRIVREGARAALELAISGAEVSRVVTLPTRVVTPALAPGSLERAVVQARAVLAGDVALVNGERRLELTRAELGGLINTKVSGDELVLSIDPVRTETWLSGRRGALEAPARDATFIVTEKDEVQVAPGEAGVRLSAEEVAAALWVAARSESRRAELPLKREPAPALTTERAQGLGIARLVGSFSTRYQCCQPRVENIHRIAKLMDGLVVEPQQTVSVNAVVGPRTQKNGFVLAPSIQDGEMVDTVGGGVSQFATTLFNALFHAGYDIIERQPHTYWFPRYPMAHEATLSWPKPDIVFRNDSDAGLLIKTAVSKTNVVVKLYGDTQGRRVSSSVSERRDIVQPSVELLPNREIEPDEEKVKDAGMIGWSVIASRIVTFASGEKKEEKRKVTYRPKARRVEVHPCRIPDGEPGATGERCPEPEDAEQAEPGLEQH